MRRFVLLFALAALVPVLGPAGAAADDLSSAVMEAKFMAFEGPNAQPDFIDEGDAPVIFDGSTGGMSDIHGAGVGLQVNDPALDNIQFFPNALPQPQRPYELSIQSETSVASFGDNVVTGFNNSATAEDPQHVHPAIATAAAGKHLTIAYYVQQADGKLAVHALTAVAVDNQDGLKLQGRRLRSLGPAFDLIPSNLLTPAFGPNATTNYDRTIRPCYDIGEYMSATGVDDQALAVFGDNRNTWTSPPQSPAAGTHTQPDVFAVFAGSW